MKATIPTLPVINIANAVDFYINRMGFKNGYSDEGFAKLMRDEIEIHLWASKDKSWRYRSIFLFVLPICSGAESFLAGTASCRIQVDSIDLFYDEFRNSGVLYDSNTQVEKTDWATKEFATLDLHRNLITFFERI